MHNTFGPTHHRSHRCTMHVDTLRDAPPPCHHAVLLRPCSHTGVGTRTHNPTPAPASALALTPPGGGGRPACALLPFLPLGGAGGAPVGCWPSVSIGEYWPFAPWTSVEVGAEPAPLACQPSSSASPLTVERRDSAPCGQEGNRKESEGSRGHQKEFERNQTDSSPRPAATGDRRLWARIGKRRSPVALRRHPGGTRV